LSQQIIKLLREAIDDPATSAKERANFKRALSVYEPNAFKRADVPDAKATTALSPYAAELDRKMGISRGPIAAHWDKQDPSKFSVPVLTQAQARTQLAAQTQKANAQ
jgi:hypothetical protein